MAKNRLSKAEASVLRRMAAGETLIYDGDDWLFQYHGRGGLVKDQGSCRQLRLKGLLEAVDMAAGGIRIFGLTPAGRSAAEQEAKR